MQPESANPMDYMSPLWTVLIVILVIMIILYVVARPLHQYLTDRKTHRLIGDHKVDSGAAETETPAPSGDEPGEKSGEKPGGKTGEEEKKDSG